MIGNVAKLDNWTLNALSGGYLATRVLYNFLYITGNTDGAGKFLSLLRQEKSDADMFSVANARSVAFLAGIGCIWTFFIKSGNALKNSL